MPIVKKDIKGENTYAGFWIRFYAGTLDLLFLALFLISLVYIFGLDEYYRQTITALLNGLPPMASPDKTLATFLEYGISITYVSYFVASSKQATIGKRFTQIYVGNRDGSQLNPIKSFARSVASILTSFTLGIGFIIVIFSKERVTLHDFICNTRVFHGKK